MHLIADKLFVSGPLHAPMAKLIVNTSHGCLLDFVVAVFQHRQCLLKPETLFLMAQGYKPHT